MNRTNGSDFRLTRADCWVLTERYREFSCRPNRVTPGELTREEYQLLADVLERFAQSGDRVKGG
jgi:hypothetical protein